VVIYFHIDEIGRDAITACALKKKLSVHGIKLIYGNRLYTSRVLNKVLPAFDLIVLPRPMFLASIDRLDDIPPVVILLTESVGRVVDRNNDKFTLYALLDKEYMEGDTKFMDMVSTFCVWGNTAKNRIDKYYPSLSEKIYVTGHPRHDHSCLEKVLCRSSKRIKKVGLITRQPLLNDFYDRSVSDAVVADALDDDVKYSYQNSKTGDSLLVHNNSIIDDAYLEASDINIMIQLMKKFNKSGYEVYLKVHPRENRKTWLDFQKKYDLKINLVDWKTPFSKWLKGLDFVVGPASTSFYDCCVSGVRPICTSRIDKKRIHHLQSFSEEYGELMKYIDHPDTIEGVIDIIENSDNTFELSDPILRVLSDEADYPDSANSLEKVAGLCRAQITERYSGYSRRRSLFLFAVYSTLFNLIRKIQNLVHGKKEQGSTFILSKDNINYIDSLVD